MSRSRKTNKTQMELLINFLENNRILISGKCHPLHPGELETKWEELTNILNEVQNGAKKNKKLWKTFLYEWKSKTKNKARINNQAIRQTGGGGYICDDLNELENRLMAVFGWVHVIGCPDAPKEVDPDDDDAELMTQQAHIPSDSPPPADILLYGDVETEIEFIEHPEDQASTSEVLNSPAINRTSKEHHQLLQNIISLLLYIHLISKNIAKCSAGVIPKVLRPIRRKKVIPSSTKLDSAAEKYSQSTEQMALAVEEMALAISKLAEASTKLADALNSEGSQTE